MFRLLFFKSRQLFYIGILGLLSYSSSNQTHKILMYKATLSDAKIHQLQQVLKRGDLIFRQGTASESIIIRQLSGSELSHVGVITQILPTIKVVHATTDDDPEKLDQVIVSTFHQFTHPSLAYDWKIYRLPINEKEADYLVRQVIAKIGEPFDFRVERLKGLYCTTLIASNLPIRLQQQFEWQTLEIPGLKGEVLYPSALSKVIDINLIAHG